VVLTEGRPIRQVLREILHHLDIYKP